MIGSSLLLLDENSEESNVGLEVVDVDDDVSVVLSTLVVASSLDVDGDDPSALLVALLLLLLSFVSPFKMTSGGGGVVEEVVKMKQLPRCLGLDNEGEKRP